MKTTLFKFKAPALLSILVTVPLALLEILNRRAFNETFPFALFVYLLLVPFWFGLAILPVVRATYRAAMHPVEIVIRVAFSAICVWSWIYILQDQMPCFLGVPNCD